MKDFLERYQFLFDRLFEIILWPIIQPLISTFSSEKQKELEELTNKLFFAILMKEKETRKIENEIEKTIPKEEGMQIALFIIGLVNDFTNSFQEEIIEKQEQKRIVKSLQQLIDQQIIINWTELTVQQSIMPLLIYSLKTQAKISDAQQTIMKIILAVIQEQVTAEEAGNQLETILRNNYNVPEEVNIFVQSFIRTIAVIIEKNGLTGLARIGETSIIFDKKYIERNKQLFQTVADPVVDRKKIINAWSKNILNPSSIGLKIGGKVLYEKFIQKCKENFELFLDQSLSAEDFEKRLDTELKKFGGEDEELIMPIRESIASSVRFLEVARIEDPSLGLLLMILDEEKENSKRYYS